MDVTCPNCKERITRSDDKKYVDCPFCGYEFSLTNEQRAKLQQKNTDGKNGKNVCDAFEKLFKKT